LIFCKFIGIPSPVTTPQITFSLFLHTLNIDRNDREDFMKTILDLHNIYYSYHTSHGETRALSNLSFSLAPGEFAAVVGPSGCGKSTLLSLICGLMKPQTGEILPSASHRSS
jgi:NitT/TauT family transport system ATP-binding protein